MNPTVRIRKAAEATDPQSELKNLAQQFAAEGHGKDAIYGFFEAALLEVRTAHGGDESAEEESVLEVMDLLTGFCDPDVVMLPDR